MLLLRNMFIVLSQRKKGYTGEYDLRLDSLRPFIPSAAGRVSRRSPAVPFRTSSGDVSLMRLAANISSIREGNSPISHRLSTHRKVKSEELREVIFTLTTKTCKSDSVTSFLVKEIVYVSHLFLILLCNARFWGCSLLYNRFWNNIHVEWTQVIPFIIAWIPYQHFSQRFFNVSLSKNDWSDCLFGCLGFKIITLQRLTKIRFLPGFYDAMDVRRISLLAIFVGFPSES